MDAESLNRRKFMTISGAAAAAATVGIEGILAARQAPAHAQGTKLHLLRWNDFVPAADEVLLKQMPEASKALGAEVTLERINANDLQARITAAISSGSGPDIIHVLKNWPHLYEKSLADVSDVAEATGKAQGGFYPAMTELCKVGSSWRAVPHAIVGGQIAYRKSLFEEVGAKEFPKTWQQYREVGKKLKAKGYPIGQTAGHTFGDPPGPAGVFHLHAPFSHAVMGYSKNQKLAKDFLRWLHGKEQFDPWFVAQKGFSVGSTTDWEKHKMWDLDPVMVPYRTAARAFRLYGYAGPPGRAASEVESKYIITDMYAKAIQGMKPEDSVKWAESELKKIYA